MKVLSIVALWRTSSVANFKPVYNTRHAFRQMSCKSEDFLNAKSIHTTRDHCMDTEQQQLRSHLKKYYGVDVEVAADGRIEFPWTCRNSDDILEQLLDKFSNLPNGSSVLELASGSGEHISKLAKKLPYITFHPTEGDSMLLPSIEAWTRYYNLSNVSTPVVLDYGKEAFSRPINGAWVINVTHITPWSDTVALFANIAKVLKPSSWFGIYGAFNRDGQFTSESNKEFDKSLRYRNSEWGIRDMEVVRDEAKKHGLMLESIHEMPANNFMLWFRL